MLKTNLLVVLESTRTLEYIAHFFRCKFFLQLGIDTVPVLVGPVSYLLLSKPAKGVHKTFPLLSLLEKILPVYK